ncbi:MAG: hypothetical protein HGB04_09835 [Chlorobiaceae bacterium]|nr:hypothetical protein [Chlorobiaceae bacterium]
MSKILLMQAMQKAWATYVRRINRYMKSDRMDYYLSQEIEMGMKLEEFAEIVFMAGFSAGEKYAGTLSIGNKKCKPHLN